MVRRYRVTEISLAGDSPPPTDPPKVQWGAPDSSTPEGLIGPIEVRLSEPAAEPVSVVFDIGDATTATYKQHWQLRAGPTPTDQVIDRPLVLIGQGDVVGYVYLEALTLTTDLVVELDLVESVTWSDGAQYSLSGATLDTDGQLDHQANLEDSGVVRASFVSGASTVNESDATVTHNVTVKLTAASGGGVSVDVSQTGGTAVAGVDFDFPSTPPVTLSFGVGEQEKDLALSILDTPTDFDDETLTLGLSNYVGCSAGQTTSHTVTIRDDDVVSASGQLEFTTGDDAQVTEGNTIALPVFFDGGTNHNGFQFSYIVENVTDGPSGIAATFDDWSVDTPNPLYIQAGTDSAVIRISTADNLEIEGNRDFKVTLSVVPVGVTLGTKIRHVQIVDNDGPGQGADGDLTDHTGTRYADERRQYDQTTPHCWVLPLGHPAGSSSFEVVNVPSDIADSAGTVLLSAGNYTVPVTGSAIAYAARRVGEAAWWAMHGPNGTENQYADTTVPSVGSELKEVLIGLKTKSPTSHFNARGYDDYVFFGGNGRINLPDDDTGGPEVNPIAFFDGPDAINWGDTTRGYAANNANRIRDIIVFTDHENGARCASIPDVDIQDSGQPTPLDNVRFERVAFRFRGESGFKSALGQDTSQQMGRLKLYDCQQGIPYNDAWTDGDTEPVHKQCMMVGAAAYDIRHAVDGTIPWPAVYLGSEHGLRLDHPMGSRTYAGISGSHLLNIEHSGRLAPNHPNAAQDGQGRYQGPRYGGTSDSFIQVANQPALNSSWDCGSGDLNIVRCHSRGLGSDQPTTPPTAYVIYQHAGHVRLIDCRVEGGELNGKCGGALALRQAYSGEFASGPHGRYRLDLADSRKYATEKFTLDGLRCGGDSQGQAGVSLWGVYDIRLIDFNFSSWSGPQFRLGDIELQPGDGFVRYFRTDELRQVGVTTLYTGLLSAYGGWTTGTKFVDATHGNWNQDSTNVRTLGDTDIDNLPTDYPAGHPSVQSNGIIDQHYANRVVASWGATPGTAEVDDGQGSPAWTGTAYSTATQPRKINVGITGGATQYVAERGTLFLLPIDWQNPCQSRVRVYYHLSDSTASVTVDRRDQINWSSSWSPTYTTILAEAATTASGQVTLSPTGGNDGTGLASDALVGFNPPIEDSSVEDYFHDEPYWDKVALRVTPKTGLPLGTKTLTVTLDDSGSVGGGNQPDFETYPGSATYEDCLHTYGSQQVTVKVVPYNDLCKLIWGSLWVDITDLSAGGQAIVRRRATGNSDALQFASSCTVEVDTAQTTYDGDFDFTSSLSWAVGDPDGTIQTVTVSNLSQSQPNTSIWLKLTNFVNANEPQSPDLLEFRVQV